MTPKEKAEELMQKFSNRVAGEAAIKACAIICVEEIISTNPTGWENQMNPKRFWDDVLANL